MTPNQALTALQGFISMGQLRVITAGCRGEEGDYFRAKLTEYGERIAAMPKTYDQGDLGEQAVISLHYFIGGCDWYITERDIDEDGEGQIQAFGLADLFGDGGEIGYISIPEILANGGELDLHFAPCTLAEVKADRVAAREFDAA